MSLLPKLFSPLVQRNGVRLLLSKSFFDLYLDIYYLLVFILLNLDYIKYWRKREF